MALIHQALLGYDNGHRLLAASVDLPRTALGALVALSDTEVRDGRVITGLPLAGSDLFALCATWPAPEINRPGAVWAHAILVRDRHLGELAVDRLAGLLAGPADSASPSKAHYRQPLEPHSMPARQMGPAESSLLDCARAAYASRDRRAYIDDLEEAEAAVLMLWSAQWPALRARFSFRTRMAARRQSSDDVDLTVLLSPGPSRRPAEQDAAWLAACAGELAGDGDGPLLSWLSTFGPGEPPRPGSVRALGRLWVAVRAARVDEVVSRLQQRYPRADVRADLKQQLLEEEQIWWGVDDFERVRALIHSSSAAWDLERLGLAGRIAHHAQAGRQRELIAALPEDADEPYVAALLDGLAASPEPVMVADLAGRDLELAARLLSATDLSHSPDTWRLLDEGTAVRLLERTPASEQVSTLAAALAAGQLGAVLVVGFHQVISRALSQLDGQALDQLARAPNVPPLVDLARPEDVLRLEAAGAPVSHRQRSEALEALRGSADEQWLRMAVRALVEDPEALPIVFGPLHRVITDDRLPSDLWRSLDGVAPEAPDPAQRLRRLLVRRIRDEHWPSELVARALRDAGPHAKEVMRDLEEDDPLTKVVKSILKRLSPR